MTRTGGVILVLCYAGDEIDYALESASGMMKRE